MKKILLASVAGAGLLASCGGTVITDNGAYVSATGIKTEFRTAGGQYVACDNVLQNGQQRAGENQVAVYFNAGGNVSSLNVNLRGNTSSAYDGNYSATFGGSQLTNVGSEKYKVIFDANPANGLLPQAIIVNPVKRPVKIVNVENRAGSFYAALTLNADGQSGTASTQLLNGGNIPVYSNCYVQSMTEETL